MRSTLRGSVRSPVILCVLATAFATAVPQASAPQASVASPDGSAAGLVTLTDCRIEQRQRVQSFAARCGSLEVAENPQEPDGRKIRLRIAVVPALNRNAARDPLVLLAGGPGQGAIDFYTSTAGAFARVQRDRDIVLVDQRGTGQSNPLTCEFPNDEELVEMGADELQRLSRRCLESLQGDARFYTTSVAVRDLDLVRAALGYEQLNIYGVSYGSRVAQHYVRRYPKRVRAVILDGVVPPEQILVTDSALLAERALEKIFARCQADAACAKAFPNSAAQFAQLRADVDTKAVELAVPDPATATVARMPFRTPHLQIAIRLLSYSAERAALIPLLIDQAVAKRNLVPLAAQAQMVSKQLTDSLAIGMHNSVVCTEDVPFFPSTAIDRGAIARTYMGVSQLDGIVDICKAWPRGPMDPDFHAPLLSPAPTLLLSGSADPVTPAAYAERAARGLRNSLHLILEGQGHGQLGTGCVPRVMAEFLALGKIEGLDATCVRNSTPAPFFLSFAGPSP